MSDERSVLDPDILEDMKDLAEEGEILPRALYDSFFRTSEERLGLMQESLEKRDFSEMRKLAHSLKGSSYNLAASRMGEVASKMEKTTVDVNTEELSEQLNQLRIEYQRAKAEICKIANPSE